MFVLLLLIGTAIVSAIAGYLVGSETLED